MRSSLHKRLPGTVLADFTLIAVTQCGSSSMSLTCPKLPGKASKITTHQKLMAFGQVMLHNLAGEAGVPNAR